jgi:hypothetical protein
MFSGRFTGAAPLVLGSILGAQVGFGAITTYTYPINSTTSSLTITAAQHGFGSTRLAVRVYDETGARKATTEYNYSINGSTFAVSLAFNPALPSGSSVKLTGPFDGPDTTASTDFKVSFDNPGGSVKVCSPCSETAFSQRSYTSKVYAQLAPVTFSGTCASSGSCTLFVYMHDNKIKFGVSGTGYGSCTGSNCAVAYGVSAYPFGVIQLGRVSYSSGYGWVGVTDDRPASFR